MLLSGHLNEFAQRAWAAVEALALGHGGIVVVAEATGISRRTIERGIRQWAQGNTPPPGKSRQAGGGRKSAEQDQPGLGAAMEALIEPLTRGDPDSPLRWTCKSTRRIADELRRGGWTASHVWVDTMLRNLNYRLQGNRKTREGHQHPGRNAQFEHINLQIAAAMSAGEPVISVDTKKKELVGNYANSGKSGSNKGRRRKSTDMISPARRFRARIQMESMISWRTVVL